jgi:hypothetical protein
MRGAGHSDDEPRRHQEDQPRPRSGDAGLKAFTYASSTSTRSRTATLDRAPALDETRERASALSLVARSALIEKAHPERVLSCSRTSRKLPQLPVVTGEPVPIGVAGYWTQFPAQLLEQ